MRTRPMLPVLSVLVVAALAGAAEAGTLRVPQQHATIQAAVDAAGPGDRIQVSKGLYRENVVVPAGKDGLQIRGKGATVDGTIDAVRGVAFTVESARVVIEGIAFRNGDAAADVRAADVVVRKCTQQSTRGRFVIAWSGGAATGLRVEQNRVRGYQLVGATADRVVVRGNRMLHSDDTAVNVTGNEAVVEQNLIRQTWETAIYVQGAAATVRKNTVDVTSGYGISVYNNSMDGAGALVEGNVVRNTWGDAIRAYGPRHRVLANTVAGCEGHLVYAQGDDIEISRNRLSDARTGGIWVLPTGMEPASGSVVEGNTVTGCMGEPFRLRTSGASVLANRSVESGERYHDAFVVLGDANTLDGNAVSDVAGHGFWIVGAGNTLTRCAVTGSASSGFRIDGAGAANRLDSCAATGSAEYGILNFDAATELRGCTFTGSGLADVTNNSGSTFPVFERVKYATGGDGTLALWESGELLR